MNRIYFTGGDISYPEVVGATFITDKNLQDIVYPSSINPVLGINKLLWPTGDGVTFIDGDGGFNDLNGDERMNFQGDMSPRALTASEAVTMAAVAATTSDPGVIGRLYNVAGAVFVSLGP